MEAQQSRALELAEAALPFELIAFAPGANVWRPLAAASSSGLAFTVYYAAIREDPSAVLRLVSGSRVIAQRGRTPHEGTASRPAAEWAVYNLDSEHRFMAANPAALAYWERSAEEVLGRRLLEAFPEAAGSAAWEAHLSALRSFETFRGRVISPILRCEIELAIFPHARGLRVAFRLAGAVDAAE